MGHLKMRSVWKCICTFVVVFNTANITRNMMCTRIISQLWRPSPLRCLTSVRWNDPAGPLSPVGIIRRAPEDGLLPEGHLWHTFVPPLQMNMCTFETRKNAKTRCWSELPRQQKTKAHGHYIYFDRSLFPWIQHLLRAIPTRWTARNNDKAVTLTRCFCHRILKVTGGYRYLVPCVPSARAQQAPFLLPTFFLTPSVVHVRKCGE